MKWMMPTKVACAAALLLAGCAGIATAQEKTKFPPMTGAADKAVVHEMAELKPTATFAVAGHPDWMAVTPNAIWVTSSSVNHVVRLDAKSNTLTATVNVPKPCSGLAADFGSLWIPSCGEHTLLRVDVATGEKQAVIPVGPADSEGGITTGAGSVWLVSTKASDLVRISGTTNLVEATIRIPAGSFNPVFANGFVWIASNAGGTLIKVDPATNQVAGQTPVGLMPRFLTVGAGAIWVLNQGDGTIARVDATSGQRTALIPAGVPGFGGEIAFGNGAVWVTMLGYPITRIDASTNQITAQWKGDGGDSIRYAHGTLWLSHLMGAKVWRFDLQ